MYWNKPDQWSAYYIEHIQWRPSTRPSLISEKLPYWTIFKNIYIGSTSVAICKLILNNHKSKFYMNESTEMCKILSLPTKIWKSWALENRLSLHMQNRTSLSTIWSQKWLLKASFYVKKLNVNLWITQLFIAMGCGKSSKIL